MRIVLLLLTVGFFSCKHSVKRDSFIPMEYRYPIDSLDKARTFIYQNPVSLEKEYTDRYKEMRSGETFLWARQYNQGGTFDSSSSRNYEMNEIYSFDPYINRLSKVEIKRDTVIRDSTAFGQNIRETLIKGFNYSILQTAKSGYVKDTVIEWAGKKYDCIVIKGLLITNFLSIDTAASRQWVTTHYSYFAKSIGLIKYMLPDSNRYQTFNLVDIIPKK